MRQGVDHPAAFVCHQRRSRNDLYDSGASFERLGGGGDALGCADRFDAADLVAITMLGVDVKGHGALDLLTDPDGHWHRLLRALPRDARLEDPSSDSLIEPGGPAEELWHRLADPDRIHGGKAAATAW